MPSAGDKGKELMPGKLTAQSKKNILVLCVENPPLEREYKDKATSVSKQYASITGIGEDGLRQDCVLFGDAFMKMPKIVQGSWLCFHYLFL